MRYLTGASLLLAGVSAGISGTLLYRSQTTSQQQDAPPAGPPGHGLAGHDFRTPATNEKETPASKVKIIVAAKDLPVGTQLTKDELENMVKTKEVSKDSVPTWIVETEQELLDKRLIRAIRADEPFHKSDLSRDTPPVPVAPGMSLVALPISLPQSPDRFVGPGSRVDVLAAVRVQGKVTVLPIMVNMVVLAVDTDLDLRQNGGYYSGIQSTVSFAVDRKQTLVVKLAQQRHCDLSLLLRSPEEKVTENDRLYDINKVVKLLMEK